MGIGSIALSIWRDVFVGDKPNGVGTIDTSPYSLGQELNLLAADLVQVGFAVRLEMRSQYSMASPVSGSMTAWAGKSLGCGTVSLMHTLWPNKASMGI